MQKVMPDSKDENSGSLVPLFPFDQSAFSLHCNSKKQEPIHNRSNRGKNQKNLNLITGVVITDDE